MGVNTCTEGYGGLFGGIGGGVALDPYWGWISETTGLTLVPEPSQCAMFVGLLDGEVATTLKVRRVACGVCTRCFMILIDGIRERVGVLVEWRVVDRAI